MGRAGGVEWSRTIQGRCWSSVRKMERKEATKCHCTGRCTPKMGKWRQWVAVKLEWAGALHQVKALGVGGFGGGEVLDVGECR